MDILTGILEGIPAVPFSAEPFWRLILTACGCAVAAGLLGRLLLGKRSGLNHAVSSALGILALYLLGILLYWSQLHSSLLLDALPFVSVQDGKLAIFPLLQAEFPLLCSQLLRMVLLSFVMNLLDTWIPRGKNVFTWLLLRCLTLVLAICLQGAIHWLLGSYLPLTFQSWAPVILLVILVASLLLGALKVFVGLALATVNPIIGGLYTFFFATLVGKQLSKAILTTLLLSALVVALEKMGYLLIVLSSLSLAVLLPAILIFLALWYIIGHLL